MRKCSVCHQPERIVYIENLGIDVCEECLYLYFDKCLWCGEYHDQDDMSDIIEDGFGVCKECASTKYKACRKCGFVCHESWLTNGVCDECQEVTVGYAI